MASEAAETLTNALLDAVKFGNAEAVRRLLEAGAERSLRDAKGRTAAKWAALRGHDALRALLAED